MNLLKWLLSPAHVAEQLTLHLSLGKSGGSAPKPDPQIGEASKKLADIAERTEERNNRESLIDQARLERLEPVVDGLFRSQIDLSNSQSRIADANQNRLTSSIWPIERTLMADSIGYYDADPEMAAAIERQMRGAAMGSYGYDARLGALTDAETAYNRDMAAAPSAAINRGAIEDELRSKFTYDRPAAAAPGGYWSNITDGGTAYIQGQMIPGLGLIRGGQTRTPQTVFDQEGFNRAVQSRVDEQMRAQQGVNRPVARDFAAERAALERGYSGYQSQIDSEIEAMRLYRDSDLAAREAAARDAAADIQGRFAGANAGQRLEMARMGVGPDSGRYASMASGNAAMEAAASAAAMNTARQAAKQLGWAKRMDSAALGRGLPGNQATSTGLALQGLGGAQNSALVPGNVANQNRQAANQGAQLAGSLYGQSGNLALGGYQAQLGAWGAQQQANAAESAGFGSFAGAIGASLIKQSDRRLKKDIMRLGELPDGLGVYAFAYIESGNRDVGVMADEVEKVYPEAISEVRGFKMVDYSYFDSVLEPWRQYAEMKGYV